MKTEIQIESISVDELLPLRARVLRPGQETEKAENPFDRNPETLHLGLYLETKLVCVATFHLENHKELPAQKAYRLRGMATDEKHQGKGLGKKILCFAIDELKKRKCDLLWCNARVIAFPFYLKLGLQFHGELFEIPEIGPHKVMYKYLNES